MENNEEFVVTQDMLEQQAKDIDYQLNFLRFEATEKVLKATAFAQQGIALMKIGITLLVNVGVLYGIVWVVKQLLILFGFM